MSERMMAETYDPNRLFDLLIQKFNLKNDAALALALDVAAPTLSKIRHRTMPLGPSILLRIHEVSGISFADMRAIMGDRRSRVRANTQFNKQING